MTELQKNIIHDDPKVFTIDNFFTPIECNHVINLAKGNLKRATVSTAKKGDYTKGRTGSNCWIPHNHDRIMMSMALRISKVVGLPITHAEQFQVIYYGQTQEYSAHYDSYELEDDNEKSIRCLKMGGQRLWTALGYLNKPEEGGHTEFIKLKKKVDAVTGRLLVFQDYKKEVNPKTGEIYYHMHLDTLHAGTPIIKGEKWGFNLWFRQKKLTEFFDLRNLFKNYERPDLKDIQDGKPLQIGLPSNIDDGEINLQQISTDPVVMFYQNALRREYVVNMINHSKMKGFTKGNSKTFMINNNIDSFSPVIKKFESILKIDHSFFENFRVTIHKKGNVHCDRLWNLSTNRDRSLAGFRGQRIMTVIGCLNNNFE